MFEEGRESNNSSVKEMTIFIVLCVVVFSALFAVIPQKQTSMTGKNRDSKEQGDQVSLKKSSFSKEEHERLTQDITAIQRNIAAKNKQGADTFAAQYVHMGGIYETLGQIPQARNAYTRAILEDAKNMDARIGLGNVYVIEKRYDEAEAAYRGAVSAQENDIHGYLVLADFYSVVIQDEEMARSAYLRGLLSTDNHATLARAYANFLETIGRNYEAYLYWVEVAKGDAKDREAREHIHSLRPSVEDAIRATEQGSMRLKK